ncbi:integrase catalytic domain-containing protein [Trichonephila clavipes]|uniref:Integrase catalytic domain-containing protein n=1 Tax=Trichonephila clavipes TaxID=2585209 RepID=A0A8X6VMU1_TRICX|nr:integrase catalytic domain-containing protein [Trichonephila clavipes]
MKRILLRVAKSAIMNFEELTTLMAQIEAVLNSRPLSPLSLDPNDLNPLTPGHFLTNCAISSFPEPYTASDSLSYHSRWKLIQSLRDKFWNRWSTEYLTHLQTRAKWSVQNPNLMENQLVHLKDRNTKPLDWPMGRILEVFPGSDGLVRVVNVKTSTGILKRAITKVTIVVVRTRDVRVRSLVKYPLDKTDHLFREAVTGKFRYRYTTLPPVSRWIAELAERWTELPRNSVTSLVEARGTITSNVDNSDNLRRSLRLRGLSPEFGLLKENSRKRTKMPTEQEAKPAVVTPSLQQWRSPSTFRGAPGEDPLKWLKEYDRVATFNKWDDMMCLANVYFFLDGTARQWYVNNEDALDS